MGYNVRKINPLDLQPRKAVGINYPLSGNNVFDSTYTSKDALKANIVNLLLTGTGERYLNGNLGTGLRSYLFENITEGRTREIKASISSIMQVYFPNVEILELIIQADPTNQAIVVFIRWRDRNSNEEDSAQLEVQQ